MDSQRVVNIVKGTYFSFSPKLRRRDQDKESSDITPPIGSLGLHHASINRSVGGKKSRYRTGLLGYYTGTPNIFFFLNKLKYYQQEDSSNVSLAKQTEIS